MNTAILIGNDINSLSPGYSWSELLEDLIVYVGAKNTIEHLNEQFPLFYEELCIFADTNGTRTEKQIKDYIANKVIQLPSNYIHKRLVNLDVNEIITSNYEFSLEKVLCLNYQFKNKGLVNEKRYSIFRNDIIDNKRFWHMHGDANNSNSIALGYEHYSGYLQNMRNYVVSGTHDSYKKVRLEPLINRLRNNNEIMSWVDLFFTHDLHIIGLGLDFVEIHLWWLLTYRAKLKNRTRLNFNNNIYYYHPKSREKIDKTKLRFLMSNRVILESCSSPDKKQYYANVVQRISKNINNI